MDDSWLERYQVLEGCSDYIDQVRFVNIDHTREEKRPVRMVIGLLCLFYRTGLLGTFQEIIIDEIRMDDA